MDHYKETFETWNKVASSYQEKFMDLPLYNETYDIICSEIKKKNAEILDVGCGPGNITKYLLSKRPDFELSGIDIAPNMIELAKKNNPTAKFTVMDIREINVLTNNFNGIICGFSLPYISKTEAENLIFNAKNLLSENGILYISFVEGDPNKSGYQVNSKGDRSYFYYHRLERLKQQLHENSFDQPIVSKVEFQRSENEKEMHTIVIARKNSGETITNNNH